jgi:hypothetical protein
MGDFYAVSKRLRTFTDLSTVILGLVPRTPASAEKKEDP